MAATSATGVDGMRRASWLTIQGRVEGLDLLPGDARPAQAADQLLGLAAEHAAGDHLDPAGVRGAQARCGGAHGHLLGTPQLALTAGVVQGAGAADCAAARRRLS
jgi:hypothetical protein